MRYQHFSQVPLDEWPWRHFTPEEMSCRKDGVLVVDPDFMQKLEEMRERLGFPMVVTSGYRTPEYNREVSKTGFFGPHTTGRAADIRVHPSSRTSPATGTERRATSIATMPPRLCPTRTTPRN